MPRSFHWNITKPIMHPHYVMICVKCELANFILWKICNNAFLNVAIMWSLLPQSLENKRYFLHQNLSRNNLYNRYLFQDKIFEVWNDDSFIRRFSYVNLQIIWMIRTHRYLKLIKLMCIICISFRYNWPIFGIRRDFLPVCALFMCALLVISFLSSPLQLDISSEWMKAGWLLPGNTYVSGAEQAKLSCRWDNICQFLLAGIPDLFFCKTLRY